jgi:hypothetical protein
VIRFHGISRLDGGDLDGIHLLWSPPSPTGHSLDGFTIFRRDARGEYPRHCFEVSVGQLSEARSHGFVAIEDALVWADSRNRENATAMWTYRAELVRRHSEVEVTAPDAQAAFVGTADGTVIAGAAFTGTSVTLRGSGIAIVWIATDNPKHPLWICGDTPSEREWSNEKPIVSNLQVPFSSVNGAVGSPADGRALAAARADPEPLDGDFDDVTRHANAALERPGGVPAMRVMSERPGDGGDAWDVSPYGLAAAPALMAPWRRGWGFSHLDRDGLTPGAAYDYRIVGTVPRRDRDELAYDLHTVPRGYRLPRCFRWGTVTVWSDRAVRVEAIDTAPGDPATFRKGFETGRLVVALDEPSSRIVVEAAPGPTIQADGFRYGTPVASTSAPASERTDLDLGVEVDTVVLEGRFAIAGITPHPIDPGHDPDEPVEISQTIYGIEWVPTAGPEIPGSIAVVNLSDPARTAERGAHDANRGFAIDWDAPPAIDPAALPFLPGSAAAAPTEVVYYLLERSWAGRPFAPAAGEGMQVSGRNASTGTDSTGWGVDLLRLFPPADAVPSSHSTTVSAVEVFEPDELDYGDEVTYRVASVDATGRVSGHRTSGPTPLRKHVRPPAPTTPPATTPVDPDDVPRSGVQVVLLQHDDPDLTATQSALAGSGDVVVVRWGWGPEQRDLDPDVTEFRVYRHGSPLTALDLQPAGPASPSATGWSVPMTVSRPVVADELADVSVVLGAAFRIEGHGAGTSITLALAPNAVDPTLAPTPGPLTVNRTTSAELDPEYWDERVLVVPRTPASGDTVEGYEQVIPAGWIATSASMPRQRVAYGVTAADAEPYVTDRRAAVEPAPRPGNESTVAAAEVSARYFGRPQLAIADLADVPAVVLDRQAGDDVHGTFRPANYAPAGASLSSRMLLERLPAAAVLRRLHASPASITLVASDDTETSWPLSADDASAIRDGLDAGMVPDRFAAHAAPRLDGLDDDAVRLGFVDPAAPFEDTLPNRPSRWLYRLRAVDAASRPSAEAQVLGVVLHVPSAARARPPRLVSLEVGAGGATVSLDVAGVVGDPYVFLAADSSLTTATASLATIRNRDDLAPIDRLVVRDAEGRALPALVPTPGAGTTAVATAPVPPGGPVLHAWAVSVSPDGVPSRLVGPLHADATEA